MASNNSYILSLRATTVTMTRTLPIVIITFGVAGNILNTMVLSRKKLRLNPCAFYFVASSISSIIAIVSGLINRMLGTWLADPTETIAWLCKTRALFVFPSKMVAGWLIASAAIDRWLTSSEYVRRRQMSSIKNAYRGTALILIFALLLHGQVFYCFEANVLNAPSKCYMKLESCLYLNDLIYAIFSNFIPITVMFIFGLLTIVNIRRSQQRINLVSTMTQTRSVELGIGQNSQTKRLNRRLLLTLFIQIFLYIIFAMPQVFIKMYTSFSARNYKAPVTLATESLIFNIFLLLSYFVNVLPFYVYTLAGGKLFRDAVFTRSFKNVKEWIQRRLHFL